MIALILDWAAPRSDFSVPGTRHHFSFAAISIVVTVLVETSLVLLDQHASLTVKQPLSTTRTT